MTQIVEHTHEIWNFSRGITLLPIEGRKNPVQVYPQRPLCTSDESVILAAMEFGRPFGVNELKTSDDDDTDVPPDNQPL